MASTGPAPLFATASTTPSICPGTAKGMTLMVATISLVLTGVKFGSVASVRLSSTAFMRAMRLVSSTKSPAVSARILTRPVAARERASKGAASTRPSRSAASSSGTSPTSSRAAITSRWPPSRSAAMAPSSSTVPFFKTRPVRRMVCARIAPFASSSRVGPKIMP